MSDITSGNLGWSSPTVKLDNGYLSVVIDIARPRVSSLRIDPSGHGSYSPNQLATGLELRAGATFPASGALTQYVDAQGNLHSSTSAKAARVIDEQLVPTTGMLVGATAYSHLTSVTVGSINYGSKRETWTISLAPDAPELNWHVEEDWIRPTEIIDCRTPAFWFAQRDDWGEPLHAQFLRRGMIFSDPYGAVDATLVSGGYDVSRAVLPDAGESITAKTYSRTQADLHLSGNAHLQRAAVLNWWSYLGQTRITPTESSAVSTGRVSFDFGIRLIEPERTGTVMRIAAPAKETSVARRLFATHANCAMVANTRDGYLGNEPDGYHATMVSWMHARALVYATEANPVSSAPHWTTRGLMRQQLQNIADSTDLNGVVGSGYAADTALDTNSSFALSLYDYAITSGDRDFVRGLLDPVRRALDNLLARAASAGGLLAASLGSPDDQSDAVIDYWDWLRRPGSVCYPNVLLFHALDRHAEVERWVGDPGRSSEYAEAAAGLGDRIVRAFWDEDFGCLAESALDNRQFTHLYTAVQYLAITCGLLDPARSRTVMDAIDARLAELPEAWRSAIAMPTNLFDAAELMPRFTPPADAVVEFGHTMNGGSLLSWAYFEIGALITQGRVADAWARARAVLDRFDATALLEGCNYWDYRGRPSRARLEPFLSDVGLVASALPRWFMGIAPLLDRIDLDPALPTPGPWELHFEHLGSAVQIVVVSWLPGDRVLRVSGLTVPLRLLVRGQPLASETVSVNGVVLVTNADGEIPPLGPPRDAA